MKAVKDKKDSVLSKHKRWLSQLQKLNREKEEKCQLEAQRKEDLRKRLGQSGHKHDISRFLSASDNSTKEDQSGSKPETTIDLVSNDDIASLPEAKGEGKRKPAWAKTSTDAEKSLNNAETDEIENLLEFTNNLDFEKYINDIEVKSMIELLQKKIAGLEKDIEVEDRINDATVNLPTVAEKKVEIEVIFDYFAFLFMFDF